MVTLDNIPHPAPQSEACVNSARGWVTGDLWDEVYTANSVKHLTTTYICRWMTERGLTGAAPGPFMNGARLPAGVEEVTVNTYRGWVTGPASIDLYNRDMMYSIASSIIQDWKKTIVVDIILTE